VTPEAADISPPPADSQDRFSDLADRLGITGPYIFNVGGLDARKRVDLLIEAFAVALPRLPAGMQLVIGGRAHSGNSTVFPALAPLIDRLGIRDRVILTGWLSEEDKFALYRSAMIYASPSIYEGFGLTPLEAMASGTPVIAANRTSIPEVVGDAGVLLEPDAGAWANALIELANDAEQRSRLARRGVERAAMFSWRRMAEQTMDAYREAVALSRRG
jgi:glycosyltransferase involved in cell wall biosynthesis